MVGKRHHKTHNRKSVRATPGRRQSRRSLTLLVAFIGGLAIAFGALMIASPSRDTARVAPSRDALRTAVVTLPVSPVKPPRGETPAPSPPIARIEITPPQAPTATARSSESVAPTRPSGAPPARQTPPIEQTAVVPPPVARLADTPPLWRRHAVAMPNSAGKAMIAIVIDDMGLDQRRTAKAIKLPGPLTLAFLPYASDLPRQTAAARAKGHELMVHVSMQPLGADNPGPNALTTDLPPGEIKRRLDWALAAFEGYVGINNHMGSRFTTDRAGMAVVMAELKARGLLFLDSRTGQSSVGSSIATAQEVPHATRHVFLDHELSAGGVARQLAETERIARQAGFAVAIGHPHDVTIAALEAWLPSLDAKSFVLAPVSAIVARLEARRGASQTSAAPAVR